MKERNEELFYRVIEENKNRLISIAAAYAPGENGRDLYQEILLRIWKSFGTYKGQSTYATWVYRIALNTATDYLNDRKRHATISIDTISPKNMGGPQVVFQGDKREILLHFIRLLPEADRDVFEMYLNDFSYREIAEVTGLNEICLRKRISRLKKRFEEEYIGS